METVTHGQVLARFGHALSDPTRARLLLALRDAPGYPAELADLLGATRQNLVLTTARGARAKLKAKNRRRGPQRPAKAPAPVSPANTTPTAQKPRPEARQGQRAARTGRASTCRQRASKQHSGRPRAAKPQVKGWAAGDSNPEPKD
ncbi:hypothetical protein Acsp02_72890 [Actinoplanes sp. NBRC 103695]|nr:hypothetical protein Acsp02_72890 [Actinoplanes sp. NBRC 103695]